ncbi:hypothetical protein CL658_04405 [bacterium]|nr:hypothetical protein [bacterium]
MMLNSFFSFVFILVVGVFLIFSLVLWLKSNYKSKNILLGFYFFLYGLFFLRFYWNNIVLFFDSYNLYIDLGLIWILAIVFYFLRRNYRMVLGDIVHFIPVVLIYAMGVLFYSNSVVFSVDSYLLWGGFFLLLSIYFYYLYHSDFLSLVDGSILSHRQFFHFFFMGLHISLPFLALGLVCSSMEFLILYISFVFLMIGFLFFDLMFNYFQLVSFDLNEGNDGSYKKSHLLNLNVAKLEENLLFLMQQQRVFKDPLLSLKLLADMAGVSAHQLSEYLNAVKKKNFSQYLMSFRVEEAKYLLLKYDWRTTVSIGAECGFNSHSSFGRCFKLVTGVSPGIYRSENECG